MPTLHEKYITIRDALESNFDVSELRDVGLTLGISLDPRLYGRERDMVNDLLRRVHRGGQTAGLITLLRQLRPAVGWPDDYVFPPDGAPVESVPSEAGASAPLPPFPPAFLPDPGPLPDGSRVPHFRNPVFTGREDELRALARQLLDGQHPAGLVIAAGIGGIGKTQLAVEFAYRVGRYLPGGVQWVSLADEDPDAISREVIACGAAMGLWPPEQDAAIPAAEKLAVARRAWQSATPRLLVFDNCENPAVLEQWRPAGGGARLLVTSRNAGWPAGVATLRVATLPRDESRALLREYLTPAGREESDAALDDVAAELGDLPLALTVAGSYLADNPSTPVARYLADLRRVGHLAHLRPRAGEAGHDWTKHDRDVARTFQVSLDRLEPAGEPIGAAARLALAGATWLVHGEPFPWALAAGVAAEVADDGASGAAELPDAAVRRLLALGNCGSTGCWPPLPPRRWEG